MFFHGDEAELRPDIRNRSSSKEGMTLIICKAHHAHWKTERQRENGIERDRGTDIIKETDRDMVSPTDSQTDRQTDKENME